MNEGLCLLDNDGVNVLTGFGQTNRNERMKFVYSGSENKSWFGFTEGGSYPLCRGPGSTRLALGKVQERGCDIHACTVDHS